MSPPRGHVVTARSILQLAWPLLALGVAGCGPKPAAPSGSSTGSPSSTTTSPLTEEKAEFTFEAPAWHDEWKKDRSAALAKYKGKIVEVSGDVTYVFFEAANGLRSGPGGWVNLKGLSEILPVYCFTTDPQPWLRVSKGSRARIRGRAGMVDTNELVECAIVEAGPSPALNVTAEDLAKAVAADRKLAAAKYDQKFVHATGEVAEALPGPGGTMKLRLKTGGEPVDAYLGTHAAKRAGAVKDGQTVNLFGQVQVVAGTGGVLTITDSVITREGP